MGVHFNQKQDSEPHLSIFLQYAYQSNDWAILTNNRPLCPESLSKFWEIPGYGMRQLMRLWHFFVLRKLILQTRMFSHPVGLDVCCLVGPFVYFHTSCVRTAKALARLRKCAGSREPLLIAYVISTIISWAEYEIMFEKNACGHQTTRTLVPVNTWCLSIQSLIAVVCNPITLEQLFAI